MCARLVICPSLLSVRVTDSPWRGERPFFFSFPPLLPPLLRVLDFWRGALTWRLGDGERGATLLNGGAAVQDSSEEAERKRSRAGRDGCPIRLLAGGNAHQQNPLMAAWEITIHPPSPFFLSFSGTCFFFFFFWLVFFFYFKYWGLLTTSCLCTSLKNKSLQVAECKKKKKKWIPSTLPWTSLAVMDTHIRWKVKRRIRDVQVTLAVILLFVTTQASSGKSARKKKKERKKMRDCVVCVWSWEKFSPPPPPKTHLCAFFFYWCP